MTHDTVRSGVALDRPPGDRRAGRSPGGGAGPRVAPPPGPGRPGAAPPAARWPGPAALLPGVDLAAVLLVGLQLGAAGFAGAAGTGPGAAATALATVLAYAVAGLYGSRLTLSVLDDLPRLLGGAAVGVAAGALLVPLAGPHRAPGPTALTALVGVVCAVGVVNRLVLHRLVRRARRTAAPVPTLIVGSADLGRQIGAALLADPGYGLRPVGYLDERPVERGQVLPAPLLGTGRDLAAVVAAYGIGCVVIAFGAVRPAELVRLLEGCDRDRCRVLVVPRFHELHPVTRATDSIQGIPLVRLRPAATGRWTWPVKRVLDVAGSAVALALTAPLLGLCALAVRVESGPGVVFRQERVGLGGRPFVMLKLRSLRPSGDQESQTRWSVAGDPRIGPVGRLLRASSLDELPQLLNVLRGEMSLVGPRPERPYFVEDFSRRYAGYAARHRVPGGLTGWAAVSGLRGDTSIEARARFDNLYVENWSLWLDVKILLRTVGVVLRRAGG